MIWTTESTASEKQRKRQKHRAKGRERKGASWRREGGRKTRRKKASGINQGWKKGKAEDMRRERQEKEREPRRREQEPKRRPLLSEEKAREGIDRKEKWSGLCSTTTRTGIGKGKKGKEKNKVARRLLWSGSRQGRGRRERGRATKEPRNAGQECRPKNGK